MYSNPRYFGLSLNQHAGTYKGTDWTGSPKKLFWVSSVMTL